MKKARKILLIFVVIVIAIGGSGCMQNNRNKFVSYLKDKYPDDNFTFVDYEGGTMFGSYALKIADCTSENLSSEIYVVYEKDSKEFSDNYIDVKYYSDTDNAINSVLKTTFKDENVYFSTAEENFNSTTKSNVLSPTVTFDDYKAERGIPVYAFVTNKSNLSQDEIVKKLEAAIVSAKLYCDTVEIYILDEYDPEIETNDSVQNDIVVNGKYSSYLFATMQDNSGFDSVKWENK